MKELSLNILDIAQNSVTAGASLIGITLTETDETLTIAISDNGCGMSPEMVQNVTDPFCTTRTTRSVGLGIPLFRLAAEQTGGHLSVVSQTAEMSPKDHGTTTTAFFYKNHIDFTPLGDVVSSLLTLIQGCGDIDVVFTHKRDGKETVLLDTRDIRAELGDIPLSTPDVLVWMREYLSEQYNND